MAQQKSPRILMLISDTGSGHRSAANALSDAIHTLDPHIAVFIVDIWTEYGLWPFNTFVPAYKYLCDHPEFWRMVYNSTMASSWRSFINASGYTFCASAFRKVFNDIMPDLVCSIHPLCQHVPLKLLREPSTTLPYDTPRAIGTDPQISFSTSGNQVKPETTNPTSDMTKKDVGTDPRRRRRRLSHSTQRGNRYYTDVLPTETLCSRDPNASESRNETSTRALPNVPFVTVVTDLGGAHPFWFSPEVDLCFVASNEIHEAALSHGLKESQIRHYGLPLRQQFLNHGHLSRETARKRLNLDPDIPLCLVIGGGDGVGDLEDFAKRLVENTKYVLRGVTALQLAIVCGKNEAVKERLEKYFSTSPKPNTTENLHLGDIPSRKSSSLPASLCHHRLRIPSYALDHAHECTSRSRSASCDLWHPPDPNSLFDAQDKNGHQRPKQHSLVSQSCPSLLGRSFMSPRSGHEQPLLRAVSVPCRSFSTTAKGSSITSSMQEHLRKKRNASRTDFLRRINRVQNSYSLPKNFPLEIRSALTPKRERRRAATIGNPTCSVNYCRRANSTGTWRSRRLRRAIDPTLNVSSKKRCASEPLLGESIDIKESSLKDPLLRRACTKVVRFKGPLTTMHPVSDDHNDVHQQSENSSRNDISSLFHSSSFNSSSYRTHNVPFYKVVLNRIQRGLLPQWDSEQSTDSNDSTKVPYKRCCVSHCGSFKRDLTQSPPYSSYDAYPSLTPATTLLKDAAPQESMHSLVQHDSGIPSKKIDTEKSDAANAIPETRSKSFLSSLVDEDWMRNWKPLLMNKDYRHVRERSIDYDPNDKKSGVNVIVLPFVSNLEVWMGAADILVTKAGPGTIAEACVFGLPILLYCYLPGQEEGNVSFVVDNKLGMYSKNPHVLAHSIKGLLNDSKKREKIRKRAHRALDSNSTTYIARDIVELLRNFKACASTAMPV